jgi:hypothetical protein
MSDTDKDIEILALRHQLAILQRQIDKPRLTSTDRAFLAALLHRLPRARLRQFPLIVAPDTILRWHLDLIRRRRANISRKRPGRPPTRRAIQALVLRLARETAAGVTRASTANSPPSASRSPRPPCGRSSRPMGSGPRRTVTAPLGPGSCAARPTPSWPASRPTRPPRHPATRPSRRHPPRIRTRRLTCTDGIIGTHTV